MAEPQVQIDPEKMFANSIKSAMPQIRGVAASMIDAERLMRLALLCATKNPLLLQCTGESVALAVMQASEVGLEIGSSLNHAYLVPRRNDNKWEAQLQISAFGFAELAYRSGKVKGIWWFPVYIGDEFSWGLGDTPFIRHLPAGDNEEDSQVTHAYAVAELMTGGKIIHVLSKRQIERLRLLNPAEKSGKFSPWKEWYAEMACAKVVKAICKRLPKSKELAVAMSVDNAVDMGRPDLAETEVRILTEGNPMTRADRVAARMGVSGAETDEMFVPDENNGPVVRP